MFLKQICRIFSIALILVPMSVRAYSISAEAIARIHASYLHNYNGNNIPAYELGWLDGMNWGRPRQTIIPANTLKQSTHDMRPILSLMPPITILVPGKTDQDIITLPEGKNFEANLFSSFENGVITGEAKRGSRIENGKNILNKNVLFLAIAKHPTDPNKLVITKINQDVWNLIQQRDKATDQNERKKIEGKIDHMLKRLSVMYPVGFVWPEAERGLQKAAKQLESVEQKKIKAEEGFAKKTEDLRKQEAEDKKKLDDERKKIEQETAQKKLEAEKDYATKTAELRRLEEMQKKKLEELEKKRLELKSKF